ncbi:hypothetical protein [Nocardia nova]|uniref:hypothetical protein n=1 Tax=Nocardia nova TaxID=37330 RepID=UPI001895F791|nr:hypothetical protein [Nocardia nova]MBF6277004.1 hypothetical protein [Nocardia nova]
MPSPTRVSADVIETMARQLVTDLLATRFEECAAWSGDGMGDIAQADADAIVARANTLMAAVADAFAKSVQPEQTAPPRCRHEESRYGRCVSCGRTWEEQARDRAANAEGRA